MSGGEKNTEYGGAILPLTTFGLYTKPKSFPKGTTSCPLNDGLLADMSRHPSLLSRIALPERATLSSRTPEHRVDAQDAGGKELTVLNSTSLRESIYEFCRILLRCHAYSYQAPLRMTALWISPGSLKSISSPTS